MTWRVFYLPYVSRMPVATIVYELSGQPSHIPHFLKVGASNLWYNFFDNHLDVMCKKRGLTRIKQMFLLDQRFPHICAYILKKILDEEREKNIYADVHLWQKTCSDQALRKNLLLSWIGYLNFQLGNLCFRYPLCWKIW